MSGEKAPLLELCNVRKSFRGLTALRDVSFAVYSGELIGLIGPNGAGKSVLTNTVSGTYPVSAGTIRFAGEDVTRLTAFEFARRGIARTYQNVRLFRRMTVLENVLVANKQATSRPFRSVFSRRDRDVEAAEHLLDNLQLASKRDVLAGTLAYGEGRRLEIARALAGQPRLIFLDEPAAGMNEQESAELASAIRSFRHAVDAVVLIEHDVELIRQLATRLVVLDAGEVIAVGEPSEVLANPRVVEAYLGAEDADAA